MMSTAPTIIITGPTACGKTHKAVLLAADMGADIISADSRQVYRGMDIGTGKDLSEYGNVPVHMIDVVDAGYRYNLYEYMRDANAAWKELRKEGHPVVICGGTGLYVESLAKGIVLPEVPADPALRAELEQLSLAELTSMLASMKRLHNTTDVDTVKRAVRAIEIEYYYQNNPEAEILSKGNEQLQKDVRIIALDIDRDSRRKRISERLYTRLREGMVDEVKNLMEQGVDSETLIYYGLEYRFIANYLLGNTSYEQMVTGLETAIHQFAKRQMTWFRGMERRGFTLHWLPYDMKDKEFCDAVKEIMLIVN